MLDRIPLSPHSTPSTSGTADFVIELERWLGRPIARRAPGWKAAATPQGEQLNLLQ
jgi:hypothetical protein